MTEPPLPDEFDVIVIGTGLSESVLSGALSRVGKSVLHLDWNDFYGSNWASFSIKAFDEFLTQTDTPIGDPNFDTSVLVEEDETFLPVSNRRRTVADGASYCYLKKASDQSGKEVVGAEKVQDESGLTDATSGAGEQGQERFDAVAPSTDTDPVVTAADTDPVVTAAERVDDGGDGEFPASSSTEDVEADAAGTSQSEQKRQPDQPFVSPEPNSETSSGPNSGTSSEPTPESSSESTTGTSTEPNTDDSSVVAAADPDGAVVNNGSERKTKESEAKMQFPTHEDFYGQWRRFNIDLAPKVIFSRGRLVELLIQSNVARYLEFRNVTRTLTLLEGETDLRPVPCSRADVFSSKFVTMVEKRILMRVLTLCANYEAHPEEYEAFKDKTFLEFLHSKKLSKKVQHFILHSIAMVTEAASALDGLKATRKFLHSLGRYGNSAFLWPMYGVGELPQAFSRLSAVFGGTFCLRRSAAGLVLDRESTRLTAIVDTQGQKIKCKHLIVDESSIPDQCRCDFTNAIARAIYVTNKSVLSSDSEQVSLVTLPPDGSGESYRLIEVGAQCCICPPKCYLLHAVLTTDLRSASTQASLKERFQNLEGVLFAGTADAPEATTEDKNPTSKPRILWAAYFNAMEGGVQRDTLPGNVHVTSGPGVHLGFDETMEEARRIFEGICPGEEFLPRAPDPDEIAFDDEGYNTENNGNTPPVVVDGGDYAEEDDADLREEREDSADDVVPPGGAAESDNHA